VTWAEYWNGKTTVYVNARHKHVHYEAVARDILAYLPGREARVVDYGCGEALAAHRVADACGKLYLCDSAPIVRDRLNARYTGRTDIEVIDPQAFAQLPSGSVDIIVVNSLVQYLTRAEFASLLASARDKLGAAGRLVLADIIPNHVGPLQDAAELLRFARANGFLLPAAGGLVRSFFSSYRRTREEFGLLQFDEAEILAELARAGFCGHRAYPNMGHNRQRMTLLAAPAGARVAADQARPPMPRPVGRDAAVLQPAAS
jgi:SAM-dependent methyltransferase